MRVQTKPGSASPDISVRHAIIRYAESAFNIGSYNSLSLSDLDISYDSTYGIISTAPFAIHKSKFQHDGAGAIQGSDALIDATDNWWGDDSGPKAPSNPLGKGETFVGNVLYFPWTRLTVVNTPPLLSFSVTPGFGNDGVEPNLTYGSTTTVFSAVYTDSEDAMPQYMRVVVNGTSYDMADGGGDIKQGKVFSYSVPIHTFSKGIYAYHFEASDGVNAVRFPQTGELQFEVKNVPVVLVPGILGSEQKNGVWVIDPILHTYDNLLDTLRANGFADGTDLFTFPYDWHQSNVLTAFQLHQKIDEVKSICHCDKVDVVAHSMGGLATRQYAESDYYEHDINQLIFLGTPHLGAPKAYLMWEGGEFPPGVSDQALKFIMSREAEKLGYKNLFDYVQNGPITSVQQLLPVYDYLKETPSLSLRTYPLSYPKNTFLEDLNRDVFKISIRGITVTNIIGNLGSDSTLSTIRVTSSTYLPLWKDGYPKGFDLSGDKGLEFGEGDKTVPVLSSGYINEGLTSFPSEHTDLPTVAEASILKKLTGLNPLVLIDKKWLPNTKILFVKILSPADIVVIAPDGKRVGKDFVTGSEVNEIAGSFYSGFETDNEFIAIPNPLDGEYKVQAEGTGSGGEYTIASGLVSDQGLADKDYVAHILPNQISELNVKIDTAKPDEVMVTPTDSMSPQIIVRSPLNQDYLRSDVLSISVTSQDSDSGVFSQEIHFDAKIITNSSTIDLFWEGLGNHTLSVLATDFMGNVATTSVPIRIITILIALIHWVGLPKRTSVTR